MLQKKKIFIIPVCSKRKRYTPYTECGPIEKIYLLYGVGQKKKYTNYVSMFQKKKKNIYYTVWDNKKKLIYYTKEKIIQYGLKEKVFMKSC